jgi:hypothetical protein
MYVVAVVCLLPLIVAARMLLPDRYSYDSRTIQRVAKGEYAPVGDTSYLYVGRLYDWLGMADHLWAAAVLGAGLALAALYAALVSLRGQPSPSALFLVGLYTVTSGVYLGQYSKDVWVLLVVLVVLTARPGLSGEVAIIGATSLYALTLRSYWALILVTYLALRLVTAKALRRRAVVAAVACVVAGVTLTSPVVLGQSIQSFRESVNLDRVLSGDATTSLAAPDVGGGVVGEVLENLILLVELVVPVPLALIGSPQYAVFAVAIGALWFVFGRAVFFGGGHLFDGRPTGTADVRIVRAALFSVAVLTTQCLFEPDYGSYLRHLTSVLPLLIAATLGASKQDADPETTQSPDRPRRYRVIPPRRGVRAL